MPRPDVLLLLHADERITPGSAALVTPKFAAARTGVRLRDREVLPRSENTAVARVIEGAAAPAADLTASFDLKPITAASGWDQDDGDQTPGSRQRLRLRRLAEDNTPTIHHPRSALDAMLTLRLGEGDSAANGLSLTGGVAGVVWSAIPKD